MVTMAVGHARVTRRHAGDMVVMRGRSPLGNPYIMGSNATRSDIISAFLSAPRLAEIPWVSQQTRPAPLCRSMPSMQASLELEQALASLVGRAASGQLVRLLCACLAKP